MLRRGILAIVLTLLLTPSFSQEDLSGEVEMAAEILALTGESDCEAFVDHLSDLTENPVMLNSGNEEEIARLFFLTDFQVKVLANHVREHGNIATVYELSLLPGFDKPTVKLLSHFVNLKTVPYDLINRKGNTSIITTALFKLPSEGTEKTNVRRILKLRHKGIKISYGLTAENDPGEHTTFKGAFGPDFLSGHIMYQGKGIINRVIIGDYSLRFGEGLIFNNNSWQGSWLTSPSYMTGRAVAAPFTSTEENDFFRGVAIILGPITKGTVIFASLNAIDARTGFDQHDSSRFIANLVEGGLHNTESGLAARNSVSEAISGVHVSTGSEFVRFGITASFTRFSLPFRPDTTKGEHIFDFAGRGLLNTGVEFKAGTGNLLFFSEAALSVPGSWAASAGIRGSPSSRVTMNLMARYFSPAYHAFHSNAFSTGTDVSNETGIAGSIHLEVAPHLFISTGADIFRIPWLRYRNSAPSTGSSFEFRGEYIPQENLSLRLSLTSDNREYDVAGETGIPHAENYNREQLTAFIQFSPVDYIRLTTRAGWCKIKGEEDHGYLLSQDIFFSTGRLPFRFWLRFSLFSTQSYNTRLYAWENDMLNTFSIPALYGEGSRTFIMTSWKPVNTIEIRFKYSVTLREIGEAKALIHDCRAQMKMTF